MVVLTFIKKIRKRIGIRELHRYKHIIFRFDNLKFRMLNKISDSPVARLGMTVSIFSTLRSPFCTRLGFRNPKHLWPFELLFYANLQFSLWNVSPIHAATGVGWPVSSLDFCWKRNYSEETLREYLSPNRTTRIHVPIETVFKNLMLSLFVYLQPLSYYEVKKKNSDALVYFHL